MHYQFLLQPEISAVVAAGSTRITFQSRRPSAASSSERGERRSRASTRYGTRVSCDDLLGTIKIGGWNPTHLTSVFSLWTSVALPHGTMLTAFADVKYRCLQMLDGLVSTHPDKIWLKKTRKPREASKSLKKVLF